MLLQHKYTAPHHPSTPFSLLPAPFAQLPAPSSHLPFAISSWLDDHHPRVELIMPIFQDPDQPFLPTTSTTQPSCCDCTTQTRSKDPTAAEFRHGPGSTIFNWNRPQTLAREVLPSNEAAGAVTSDRAELMERIKRGESPTWVPKQPVCKGW